jgi:hypothetical protein
MNGTAMTVREWSTFWDKGAESAEWSHSGIAVLPDGRAAFSAPGEGRVVLIDPGADDGALILDLPMRVGHGLTATGDDLLIADIGSGEGDGQVLRVSPATGAAEPAVRPPSSVQSGWRPTSVAVDAAGTIWVADGYGQNLVHGFTGEGAVLTIDGSASGVMFDCPHGVVIDDRSVDERLVVADRVNRRLVVLHLDGAFDRVIEHELFGYPSSLAVRGEDLLVTDLYGALLRVGPDDEVDAIVPIADAERDAAWPNADLRGELIRPRLRTGVLRAPHGIAVAGDGAVLLTEWFIGGRQLRLELE